jgi:hypothetical protein
MRVVLGLIGVVLSLNGCAYSIKEVDTSRVTPECVRQCSTTYSSCVSGGNQVGFKTETLRACRDAYEICVNSCPTLVQ